MVTAGPLSWRWLLGFTGLAWLVWLVGLDNVPLRDVDEGQVALVARDIFCTGNWLFPTRMGEPYLNKPPLVHWLTALSYHLGGISDWTSRFPAAVVSSLAVPGMYLLGRQVCAKEVTARWAALVFLTLMPVVRHGRLAMLDGTVLTGLVFLLMVTARTRYEPRWGWGMGFLLGMLALAKGLIAVPLGVIALAFLVWEQPRLFKNLSFWVGLLLGMIPGLSWFVAQAIHYGTRFIQGHLLDQSLARTWDVVGGEPGPPWYYVQHLLLHSWPWFLFWPGGLLFAWRKRQEPWAKLSLLGTGIFLAIISLMKTKITWYVMPVYPFFCPHRRGSYCADVAAENHAPPLVGLSIWVSDHWGNRSRYLLWVDGQPSGLSGSIRYLGNCFWQHDLLFPATKAAIFGDVNRGLLSCSCGIYGNSALELGVK